MIRAENVTVRFGGVVAVNDVSMHVEKGKVTGLIGPNGAGKTTLFNTINGVQKTPEGHIYFEGKEITNGKGYKLCEAGISRTYQQINLFLGMSVLNNVMIGQHCRIPYGLVGSLFHTPKMRRQEQAAREECIKCLELVGMADKKDLPAGALAYGDQRLIEIARALATKPKVLLLDEPAAGMNATEKLTLNNIIQNITKMGITVLIIEHDMAVIMEISDYVYVMDDGHLIAEGTPAEVQNNPAVIAAYLGGA
ncbi:MAG: ABC transporter ATP-binding protein [Candidatus Faecousia sp.]|nr:ABC transporter ATP-binding protein [Clostridiales bacterium]MDY6180241.1 ABC transporter ATP-binding protein [Candidatus Faecousia sp.]